jgi:hypothetical protein
MRFWLSLAALTAAILSPAAGVSLQQFAPCEDLSPHCAALCASCEAAVSWTPESHGSFEIFAPEPVEKPNKPNASLLGSNRQKRFAVQQQQASSSSSSFNRPPQPQFPQQQQEGPDGRGWFQVPSDRPGWLPAWIPWWYRPTSASRPGGNDGSQWIPPQQGGSGGQPPVGPPGGGHLPPPPSKECSDLVNGGRQLIEAFCPKSCGRCGRSSSPMAAAKVYVNAQCAVVKEPAIGLAMQ